MAVLLTAGAGVVPAWGQPADTTALATPAGGYRVGVVRVSGAVHTDTLRIVRTFEVPAGARYADEAVRRGIRKLYALGLFADVAVTQEPRGDRMDLVIRVKERPRLARIEFTGNQKRESGELEKKLILHAGEVYSPVAVQSQLDSLRAYYRDEGFGRASVEAAVDSAAGGDVALRFVVREGEKVRIREIEFAGANGFPAKKLRKHLKTKTKGLLGGGELKEEDAAEDQEKLERFYHEHGYRDMRMVGREVHDTADPRRLRLVITVDEGPYYRIGEVRWAGNSVVGAAELAPLWKKPRRAEPYDVGKIERVQGLAYAAYAEKGYLYVGVEPREEVRDSGRVDLLFAVSEGKPSRVRYVNVSGNKMTREKVVRRELELREGDRFRRSALMRTQDELSRLGLFEEVVPDFAPAESTDVDISIRVKEKQVGTASAGAGYTGTYGLTGFIELGHSNVLGNGQTLALHLERGSYSNNYSLSFTEPWFHDTPTLLNGSAYDMATEYDLYKEGRRGGSARIGRPLPWPDFSRGTVGYSLEDVKINALSSSLSAEDSVVLSGIATGQPVRTSSMLLDFSRNSSNNAFYPTRGTRLTWNAEMAGGPFLGAVNFIKQRAEGRVYLPSLLKGVTTMARARVGVLGIWAGQHSGIPRYERFRLGGGTTIDPLRGYDDYQVVPEKYIQKVNSTFKDTTATGDSTYYQVTVRYPGGRYMTILSLEQQFPIVLPLRGVVFFDAGNTWDTWGEIQPLDLRKSVGFGVRMEIPMLGNVGFDFGYGFDRDDGPRLKGHFLLGQVSY
jgi:outer membrane protein insertion porin family